MSESVVDRRARTIAAAEQCRGHAGSATSLGFQRERPNPPEQIARIGNVIGGYPDELERTWQ